MMTAGWTLDGKHFIETFSSGFKRRTRRYFIGGKLVKHADWIIAYRAAKAADAARKQHEEAGA